MLALARQEGDNMKEFETGAVRDVGGKGRMDLLPMAALIRISKHMENAITHYPERNWEKGMPMHTMLDSALRHIAKYMDGWTDEDHLCAAATNLLMALWTEEKHPEMQDIPTRPEFTDIEEPSDDTCQYFASHENTQGLCTFMSKEAVCPFSGDPSNCTYIKSLGVKTKKCDMTCQFFTYDSGTHGTCNHNDEKKMLCPFDGDYRSCKDGEPR